MLTRFVIVLASLATACGAGVSVQPSNLAQLDNAQVSRVVVKSDDYAPLVKRLLLDGEPSVPRLNLLAGAVRHQLLRAGRYFKAGHEEAGLEAVSGALRLVRAGELRPEMFEGATEALLAAARVVARLGDEGRTEAYYHLVADVVDGAQKREVETHLSALSEWRRATRVPGSMLATAAAQQAATERTLVERTPATLEAARRAIFNWVERAFEEWRQEGAPTSQFEHDERVEANRAQVMGSVTLAALYLRDGDAGGAAAAMETEPIAMISNAKLVSLLRDAAAGAPEAWAELFGLFEGVASSQSETITRELASAAAWGAAVALVRAEPTTMRSVVPVSTLLVRQGMADVAPLILRNALSPSSEPRHVSWALRLVLQSLIGAERNQDLELARRVYANSAPVLELAASEPFLGKVRPAASELSFLMGAMESRAGELERARVHLSLAVKANPTADAFRLLSAIDRQRGHTKSALDSTRSIIALAQSEGDLNAEAEAQLTAFHLYREMKDAKSAQAALAAALSQALVARTRARTGAQVSMAERILADVLSLYGDFSGAERATTRAYDAASNDLRQLTATLLDAARRSLINSDLASGRLALRRALDVVIDDTDLIYAVLWVKTLHEHLGAASDGSVEEALLRIERDGSWSSILRDWARGALSSQQMSSRASSDVQRVEAEFYSAIGAYLEAPQSAARERIERVAKSSAIELIEVRIARELLAVPLRPKPVLPAGVVIP